MASDRSAEIRWRDWSDEVFEQAEREDRLILLDIGASWCHWCHVMDRTTYSDPEVISMINERFIPIRVDADKRPDIQDRYLLGGWPTTAFLLPDARTLTGTTFLPPESMLHKLKEVDALYREHKPLVTMQVSSMEARAEAERADAEVPIHLKNQEVMQELTSVLKNDFDAEFGGFGVEPKFPYPEGIHYAFLQYRKTGDQELLNIALKTLEGMMGIYDPVWGGFYRYSITRDWKEPHYEKMLYAQAGAIDNYLEAYQVIGDDKYGEIAAGVKSYVNRFLSDQERGGFFGSQDADINSQNPNADLILGEDYFARDEAERLSIGIPAVDKMVYTDWNGMMISSYLRLYHVMGDQQARDFAIKTADRILAENRCGDGMCHYNDGEPQIPGLLSDQVYFAQALIDLHQSTGERRYLDEAERLVSFMVSQLHDVVDGGFYFKLFTPGVKGEPFERHKPFDENVAAVRVITELSYMTGKTEYEKLAERSLNAISYPQITESIVGMGFGTVLDLFSSHPVHIVLVGDKGKEKTRDMLQASLHAYEPTKLVQILDPSEASLTIGEMTYEAEDGPVAYICVRDVCRPPVRDTDDLSVVLQNVLGS